MLASVNAAAVLRSPILNTRSMSDTEIDTVDIIVKAGVSVWRNAE